MYFLDLFVNMVLTLYKKTVSNKILQTNSTNETKKHFFY